MLSTISKSYSLKSAVSKSYSLKTTVSKSYFLKDKFSKDVTVDVTLAPSITTPTVQASSLSIVNGTNVSHSGTVTRGNGDFILIVYNQTGVVSFSPVDDVIYSVGQDLGGGNFVGAIESDADFDVTSLTANLLTNYAGFEFNAVGSFRKYLVAAVPTTNEYTFTNEYQAAIDAAFGTPPATFSGRKAENYSIRTAKEINLFQNSPRFYIIDSVSDDADWKSINYKDVGNLATYLLRINAPTTGAKQGFTGNAIDSYLDSQFTPSTDGLGLFTLNDAGIVGFCGNDIVANASPLLAARSQIAAVSNMTAIYPRNASNLFQGFINEDLATSSSISSVSSSIGLFHIRRVRSTHAFIGINGSEVEQSNDSVALPTNPILCLASRLNNGAFQYSARRIDLFLPCKGDTSMPTLNTWYNNWITIRNSA